MLPASDESSPEIWLINVVLPAPFAPNAVRNPLRRRTGSATAEPPQLLCKAKQATAGEQHDQHKERPEDHLPVLGQARQPFLGQQERGGADDRAVQRAEPA